ncbi:MAG: hypothetical protein Q8T08_12035 [Ignavibacteria bacterium]|nr:hypothetical protein [Ignavibacteria bacterium]
METTLKVKFVAFDQATPDLFAKAESKLRRQCASLLFETSDKRADIIYFISGGSELEAVNTLDKSLSTLLLAGAANNAWAAATEVKAFANQNGIETQLVSFDTINLEEQLIQHLKIISSFEKLKGQRLGLIGSVSDWLVSSDVSAETLKKVFGIELIQLPYEELEDYLTYPEDPQMKTLFPNLIQQQSQLGSVSSFLKDVVAQNKLDAITIQCFRMVKEKSVTACLPVALINHNGIPAGCEGDLVSISAIMLVKALTGIIPWMANMVAVESTHILFAHCTIPLQHSKYFEIYTHYESY